LGLSFAFAYASLIWMEEPLTRWRKTLEKRWRLSGTVRQRSAPIPAMTKQPQACEGYESVNGKS
jgi:peptidoglycan/LPS O-acetylase OafA/YrhL